MRSLPVGWPGGCGFNQSLCQHSSASHAAWWWPLTLPGMTTPGNRLAGRRPLGVRAETSLGQMCKNCCSQSSARTWELQRPLLPSSPERKTGRGARGAKAGGQQAPLTPGVALGYTGRGAASLPLQLLCPKEVVAQGGGHNPSSGHRRRLPGTEQLLQHVFSPLLLPPPPPRRHLLAPSPPGSRLSPKCPLSTHPVLITEN